MNNFTQFIINHWTLWLALVVVVVLLIAEELKQRAKGLMRLSAAKVTQMINHENAVVLDLRKADDFERGHIVDALSFPSANIGEHIKRLEKHKSAPIILVGDNEPSAMNAGVILRKNGFEKLFILTGGINGWLKENYPLITNEKEQKNERRK